MRLKIDENLPADLVEPLTRLGHDVHTLHDERLVGAADEDILPVIKTERRVLMTQDVRLADVRRIRAGEALGFILVRASDLDRATIFTLILNAFESNDTTKWADAMVVLSSTRVRVTPVGQKEC